MRGYWNLALSPTNGPHKEEREASFAFRGSGDGTYGAPNSTTDVPIVVGRRQCRSAKKQNILKLGVQLSIETIDVGNCGAWNGLKMSVEIAIQCIRRIRESSRWEFVDKWSRNTF